MLLKLFELLIITTVIKCDYHGKVDNDFDYFAPAKYTYSYGVEDFKTGDYKTHKEERIGDVVKGEYSVADPDGSIRTVTYTADKEHGFQAVVKKSDPIKLGHKLNESQETDAQPKKIEESIEYKPHFIGPTQPILIDYKQQSNLKLKPLSNDNKQQEINKHFHLQNFNKFQYNQDHLKNNVNQEKEHQETNLEMIKNLENKEILKVNLANSKEALKENLNKGLGLHEEYQQYKPEKYIVIPKYEVNDGALKNDLNTESKDLQSQLYYAPVKFQEDYGYNFKHNFDHESVISHENAFDLKQIAPQMVNFNLGKHVQSNSQDVKISTEDGIHDPEFSYQRIVNGKTQDERERDHHSEVFIGKQNQPDLYYTQYQNGEKVKISKEVDNRQPDFSYQSIVNGKPQGNLQYDQYAESSIGKQSKPDLYNTQNQQNEKVKIPKELDDHQPEFAYQNIVNGKSQGYLQYDQYSESSDGKQSKPELYYIQNQHNEKVKFPKELDYYQPAFSYQSIVNGKSHGNLQYEQFTESTINKQSKPDLYYTQNQQNETVEISKEMDNQQPSISYQTTVNGKTQDNLHHKSTRGQQNKPDLYYFQNQQNDKVHISKEVNNYKPAFSYQSIVNGKSHDNHEHHYHTQSLVGNQGKPEPDIHYKTIFNGKQMKLENLQNMYTANEEQTQQPHYYNFEEQKIENNKFENNVKNYNNIKNVDTHNIGIVEQSKSKLKETSLQNQFSNAHFAIDLQKPQYQELNIPIVNKKIPQF